MKTGVKKNSLSPSLSNNKPGKNGHRAIVSFNDCSRKSRMVVCKRCGKKFKHTYYDVINCAPKGVFSIRGNLNQIVCPHCKSRLGATAAICLNRAKKWIIVFDPQHSMDEYSLDEIRTSLDDFSEYKARIVYNSTMLRETYMCLNLGFNQLILESLRHACVASGEWKKPMYLVDHEHDGDDEVFFFIPVGSPYGTGLTVAEIMQIIPTPVWVPLPNGKFITPKDIFRSVEIGEIYSRICRRNSNPKD